MTPGAWNARYMASQLLARNLALIDLLQAGSGLPHPFEQLLDLFEAAFPDVFIDFSLDLIAVV